MLKVFSNRKVSPKRIKISNQYENKTRKLTFDTSELPEGFKYLVVSNKNNSVAYFLNDSTFSIESALTWESGLYYGNIVISNKEVVDKLESTNTLFISDTFEMYVEANNINAQALSEQPLPIELKLVYDDLLNLKKEIEDKIANGEFNGKSAYEVAVKNGFQGTEQEWLESLKYYHSEEFTQLAKQVLTYKSDAEQSAQSARESAQSAEQAKQIALEGAKSASKSAQSALEGANSAKESAKSAEQSKQSALEGANSAKQSAQSASESAESALKGKEYADSAKQSAEQAKESADSIKQFAIKESAEGNPTIINDSSEFVNQGLEVHGQSEQASTTGKNLLNPTGAFKQGWNINLPNVKFEVGKTYTFTPPKMAEGEACGLFAFASNTELVSYINNGITRSFTVKENADFSQGVILAGGSDTAMVDVDEKTAMVELGSVATEFEPYTGGKPSPNKDYPQEIISKEVSEIKVTGANLFDIDKVENFVTAYGLRTSREGEYIVISGVSTFTSENASFAIVFYEDYSLSGKGYEIVAKDIKDINIKYLYGFRNAEEKSIAVMMSLKEGVSYKGRFKVMVTNTEHKDVPYEPYKEQKITLSEPITLYSVPVSKDGNITIDSQMYKSDLICEKGGVYGVERNCYFREFKVAEMNNSEEFAGWKNVEDIFIFAEKDYNAIFNGEYMTNINNSNNLFLINTMTATNDKIVVLSKVIFEGTQSQIKEQYQELIIKSIFVRLEPTFEPLPDIDQQAIKALKTYFPTTVLNTGAFNKINYLADTKTYIENKIKEVNASLLETQNAILKGV